MVVCDDDDWCDSTRRCDRDECCIQNDNSINGEGRCVDMGDDWGDLCGPPGYCDCEPNYECVPHDLTTVRNLRNRRYRALQISNSNGTCEPTAETQRRWQLLRDSNPRWRRRYDDDDDDDDDFDDDRRRRRR